MFVDTKKQNQYTSNLPAKPPRKTIVKRMETPLKRIILPITVLFLACCMQVFADQPQDATAPAPATASANKMLSDSLAGCSETGKVPEPPAAAVSSSDS